MRRSLAALSLLSLSISACITDASSGDSQDGNAEALKGTNWIAPTCGPSLANRLTVNRISGQAQNGGRVFGAATSSGGTVVAWPDTNGDTHITEITATGGVVRDLKFSQPGGPQGLAVTDTQVALLVGQEIAGWVSPGQGKIYLVLVNRSSGIAVATVDLLYDLDLNYPWHLRSEARVAWAGTAW